MGTFNANILPTTTGLDQGSTNQRWDVFAQTLDVAGNATITGTTTHTGAVTLSGGIASGASITSPTISNPTTTGTDSGTETLQNKTLNGAANGNAITLLDNQGGASAIVGTGADVNIFTKTLNALGAGKGIRITTGWIHSTGTASVSYKIKYGATVIDTLSYANFNTSAVDYWVYTIMNNAGVQNAQTFIRGCIINGNGTATSASQNVGTSSADFSTSAALTLTFNVAATDQVTPKFWLVELIT